MNHFLGSLLLTLAVRQRSGNRPRLSLSLEVSSAGQAERSQMILSVTVSDTIDQVLSTTFPLA